MIRLETKTKEQELLKAYLEANASETLIDKINNGVKIVKDITMHNCTRSVRFSIFIQYDF